MPLGTFAKIVAELCESRARSKRILVEMTVVSPHLLKAAKLLDVAIDRLMSRASCRLGPAVGFVHDDVLVAALWITSVPSITLNHFTRQ